MRFTQQQIELATRIKANGLSWEPAVGNYVYDETGFFKPSSPFQEHVYFLLNYDCFMQKVGGTERFKMLMIWLPTWEDSRAILSAHGVSSAEVERELIRQNALAKGTELITLYQMIHESLRNRHWNHQQDHHPGALNN